MYLRQAFPGDALLEEALVNHQGFAAAAEEADVAGAGGEGGFQRHIVKPVAAGGDDDEGVDIEVKVARPVGVRGNDGLAGVGETLGVGEVLAVVHDVDAVAEAMGQVGGGLADVSAADHHQGGGSGEAFDEKFGMVINGDGFAGADGGDAAGGVQGDLIQGGGADAAGDGAVGAEEELGAQRGGIGIGVGADDGGQGGGFGAVVGGEEFVSDGGEVGGLAEGFQVEVHSAAADQSVAGGDVLVEVVVLEFGAGVVAEDFAGGEPDVAFHAAAAEGADSSAILPHQEHSAGFLGGGAFGADDRGQDARAAGFQLVDGFLNYIAHGVTCLTACLVAGLPVGVRGLCH